MQPRRDLLRRGKQYLSLRRPGAKIRGFLGGGQDGQVWATTVPTAIKVCESDRAYYNERDSYQRLADFGVVNRIGEFWVPAMHGYDNQLWVVEMDIAVNPPFLVDFGKVRIDRPPDFSEEVLAEAERMGREMFEHRPAVCDLLRELESYQIYYTDPKRGNIVFPDML